MAAARVSGAQFTMSGVTYMDSSGFSSLLSATKQLRPGGGALHLVGARPTVQRMLHLTRLDTVIFLHPKDFCGTLVELEQA